MYQQDMFRQGAYRYHFNGRRARRRWLGDAAIACLLAMTLAAAGGDAVAQEPDRAQLSQHHLRLVSLSSSVGFGFSAASLDMDAQREVEALGVALASLPQAQITLNAYTDATGPGHFNLSLSQSRADSVRAALEAAGVDPARIHVEANGEWFSQRIPAEPAAEARQRRVDIRVQQPL